MESWPVLQFAQTADTRSWEKAEDKRRQLEEEAEERAAAIRTGEAPSRASKPITVKDAVKRFLASKRNENLADSTLDKLKTIFEKQFLAWATSAGFEHLAEITTADLEAFRDTWTDGPLAKKKKQERLIGFFYYGMRLGWIKSNPAALLGRIRAEGPPTDYFPKSEFDLIVDSTYIYQPKGWLECRNQATRLRILILLMHWSGLAIRDAVTLERRRLNDKDELFLYRAKTGNPVYVPLPHDVAEALRNIPPGPSPNPRYFFWSGNGSPKSVVGNWQRSFRRLFTIANIRRDDGSPKRCHPHMFRDTFAVEMLLAGVPLEQVSILLGHKSVKITEKALCAMGESAPGSTRRECSLGVGRYYEHDQGSEAEAAQGHAAECVSYPAICSVRNFELGTYRASACVAQLAVHAQKYRLRNS